MIPEPTQPGLPTHLCGACGAELAADQVDGPCPSCDTERVVAVGATDGTVPGRVLGGRYVLLRLLGRGAMGAVFMARHVALEKNVAVKVLMLDASDADEAIARFYNEARNAARLEHPHNVRVFDFGHEEGELLYIVMEVVRGQPLSHLEPPLPIRRALQLTRQIARAVHEAHGLGLVHRDLKPDNVMVTDLDGEDFARVLDYGIAKSIRGGATALTQTGMMIGTPKYLSPEQAMGHPVDARSDVYSLGSMLYEMVAGEAPFDGPNPIAMAVAHVYREPEPPSRRAPVPEAVEALVLDMLAKEPNSRPPSMQDVIERIDALSDSGELHREPAPEPASAEPASAEPGPAEWSRSEAPTAAAESPLERESREPSPEQPEAAAIEAHPPRAREASLADWSPSPLPGLRSLGIAVGVIAVPLALIAVLAGGEDDAPEAGEADPRPSITVDDQGHPWPNFFDPTEYGPSSQERGMPDFFTPPRRAERRGAEADRAMPDFFRAPAREPAAQEAGADGSTIEPVVEARRDSRPESSSDDATGEESESGPHRSGNVVDGIGRGLRRIFR